MFLQVQKSQELRGEMVKALFLSKKNGFKNAVQIPSIIKGLVALVGGQRSYPGGQMALFLRME